MMRVGFIGLGAMGAPMAGHLAKKTLLHVVANRSFARAQQIADELSVSAGEQAEAFADCDVVALCVPYDVDVLQWVGSLAGVLRAGAVVIDHSTVSVSTAKAVAELLARHEIGFIDAPVSGGVEGAKNGKLSVMCGASPQDLERVSEVLQSYAARISHMGNVGAGQATKAVNQVLVAGINEAVCEGLAFAEQLGLDAGKLIPTLMAGAASNWFLEKRGQTMLKSEFAPGFKCSHMRKDLSIALAMAQEAGINTAIIEQALADYTELERGGFANADTSALIELKRAR